jgi:hypothetical protein
LFYYFFICSLKSSCSGTVFFELLTHTHARPLTCLRTIAPASHRRFLLRTPSTSSSLRRAKQFISCLSFAIALQGPATAQIATSCRAACGQQPFGTKKRGCWKNSASEGCGHLALRAAKRPATGSYRGHEARSTVRSRHLSGQRICKKQALLCTCCWDRTLFYFLLDVLRLARALSRSLYTDFLRHDET